MLLLTTGLIENKLVSAIDSTPTCVVSIKSVSILNRPIVTLGVRISNVDTAAVSIEIKGFHMDGTTKMEYLSDIFSIDAGTVALRQYYVQFDAFEFQFFPSSQAVEVSAWGLNSAGKSTIAYRVLPAELNSLAGPTVSTGPTAVSEHKGVGPTSSTSVTTEIGIPREPGEQGIPGEQGAPGEQGIPGEQGALGEQGIPGAQGIPGEQGVPGEQGIPGEQGAPGATGAQGATGPSCLGVPLIASSSSQMVCVSKGGNDITGNGTIDNPFATIPRAMTSIVDATPTKRYSIMVGPGNYIESISLKANVIVIGVDPMLVRIGSESSFIDINDPTWSVSGANRSGFKEIALVASTLTFDFTAQPNAEGELYFDNVRCNNI